MDRIDFASIETREWLRNNDYPQTHMSRDGSGVKWYPSLHGVQAGMKGMTIPQTVDGRTMYYWIELHRNGAVNVLWQTPIIERDESRLLNWKNGLMVLRDFANFNKTFYQWIRYFGPFRLRYSISKLDFVELKQSQSEEPLAAQLPGNTFSAELIEDSARLFENPNAVAQSLTDWLFRAYGVWEAPDLKN